MLTEIDRYLLEIGSEDYCRVWEAVVAHRKALSGLSETAAADSARETIRKLFQAGLIELYWDDLENSTEHTRLARRLNADEVAGVFTCQESWIPGRPVPDRGYAYATTDAGERALYGQ